MFEEARFIMSKIMSAAEAVSNIREGGVVMVGGFGLRGCPFALVDALVESGVGNLTIVSNDLGAPGEGLGKLLDNNQIKALVGNYYNWNRNAIMAYNRGEIEVTILPQGSFAESIRAAGVGIPAYYTPASAGTDLSKGKDVRWFDGIPHVLEQAIRADVALISAKKADTLGNLVYSKTARNFKPAMAMAARYTIALVDEIVEVGQLDPENIITPHIFVNAIVRGE